MPDIDEPPLAAGTDLCAVAIDRLADLDLRGGTQALVDAFSPVLPRLAGGLRDSSRRLQGRLPAARPG